MALDALLTAGNSLILTGATLSIRRKPLLFAVIEPLRAGSGVDSPLNCLFRSQTLGMPVERLGPGLATVAFSDSLGNRVMAGSTSKSVLELERRMPQVPEKRGQWTVLDSAVQYSNPWITVREDRVIQPDGQEGAFGVAEMKPGVSVLPIDDDGTVYLVRVYRYTLDRECLEALAGGVEDDEDLQDAARRELREEAGIEAADLIDLGVVDQLTEVVVSPDHLFLARGLSFTRPDQEETEDIERVAVPLAQAVEWAYDGTISHAASVVLILKAARHLNALPSD